MADNGLASFIGILAGLLVSLPLIWLSRHIPQQIFAGTLVYGGQLPDEPAIRALQWQDALLVLLLCACGAVISTHKGWELGAVAAFLYCSVLLLLARIDARTRLLPDMLTLPLLWVGLLWHAADMGEQSLEQSVWGAAAGYIVLWFPSVVMGRWRGRELMGHGDFKFSAAIGAWLGCLSMPFVWLIASCASLLVALLAKFFAGRRLREPMAFGPSLALGGILMLFFDWLWSSF